MTANEIELSEDQVTAMQHIRAWRDDTDEFRQTLTLGGFAGCGKTTLISILVSEWPDVAVAALCGKAANELRKKGVGSASTIHSLIYEPYESGGMILFRKLESLSCGVIIIDEASMVSTDLYDDLLSFCKPILFVGDHGQLEPIGSNPMLMKNPEIRLERIHRQAAGNPILRLATALREDRDVPNWESKDGELRICGRGEFAKLAKTEDAQFICGYNRTRHGINREIRERLGYKKLVEPGERVICLRNNKELGLFNGQQATVLKVKRSSSRSCRLVIETEGGDVVDVTCLAEQFGKDAVKDHRDREVCLYDYAYCITCHKSQGSEYPYVVVLDEVAPAWEAKRWRYTAATRAKEKLVYCR